VVVVVVVVVVAVVGIQHPCRYMAHIRSLHMHLHVCVFSSGASQPPSVNADSRRGVPLLPFACAKAFVQRRTRDAVAEDLDAIPQSECADIAEIVRLLGMDHLRISRTTFIRTGDMDITKRKFPFPSSSSNSSIL
jgi:hypothetical protein